MSVELASCADWVDSDSERDGEEESTNRSVSEASSRPSALNCCTCGGTFPVLSPVRYLFTLSFENEAFIIIELKVVLHAHSFFNIIYTLWLLIIKFTINLKRIFVHNYHD